MGTLFDAPAQYVPIPDAGGPAYGRILAFDLATRTGWAFTPDGGVTMASGVESFAVHKARGRRFVAAADWMAGTIDIRKPDLVVFEEPNISALSGMPTVMLLVGMAARIEETCERAQVPYIGVKAPTIKKHATGRGNAKKDQMVAAARQHGWTIRNDDEADALWLLDCACALIEAGRLGT